MATLGAAFIGLAAALGFLDALYCAAMAFIFFIDAVICTAGSHGGGKLTGIWSSMAIGFGPEDRPVAARKFSFAPDVRHHYNSDLDFEVDIEPRAYVDKAAQAHKTLV